METQPKTVAVVALDGEIDLSSAPEAERRIVEAEADSPGELVIDLRRVTFLDSSGLRILLAAHQRSQQRGTEFALVPGGEAVRRVLDITGLATRLRLLDEPPASG